MTLVGRKRWLWGFNDFVSLFHGSMFNVVLVFSVFDIWYMVMVTVTVFMVVSMVVPMVVSMEVGMTMVTMVTNVFMMVMVIVLGRYECVEQKHFPDNHTNQREHNQDCNFCHHDTQRPGKHGSSRGQVTLDSSTLYNQKIMLLTYLIS